MCRMQQKECAQAQTHHVMENMQKNSAATTTNKQQTHINNLKWQNNIKIAMRK